MTVDYLYELRPVGQLDVPDVGECCILARNDDGEEYYLVTHTTLGFTEIVQYGPSTPEIQQLPMSVKYSYQRIDYKEAKIRDIIDKFLNDRYAKITQADVIDIDDVIGNMRNLVKWIGR